MKASYPQELFTLGECGEVLKGADFSGRGLGADESRIATRKRCEWLRRNPDKYRAAVAAARRIIERSGAKVAPLHLAFEMRYPPRGVPRVEIENGAAVFLARLAAQKEPDLKGCFSLRPAASDAFFVDAPDDFAGVPH